jgi:DNA-binding LacI/PurR family transcriptional regulator
MDRKKGYLDCLRDKGILIRESLIIESDFSIQSGELAADVLLSLPVKPDAIFCVCDAVAFGVMKTLKRRNIRIPNDISVMGYTDEPVAELVEPPLSTVAQPISEIGEKAVEFILKSINNKFCKGEKTTIMLETSLVIRESTI